MVRFLRSLAFRHTLIFVGLFVLLETVVFGVLYWSTVLLYERHTNASIESQAITLQVQASGLAPAEIAAIVTRLCNDEPGEFDEYLLASQDYTFMAGNLTAWPAGVVSGTELVDLDLGDGSDGLGEDAFHRVRALTLAGGEHLLVGRNLTEFVKLRQLIAKALLRTVAVSALLGLGAGYVFSRRIAARLDGINRISFEILRGDVSRRVPLSGSGDEFDELALNLNRSLDRIEGLLDSMRTVTSDIAHDLRQPISRLRSRIEVTLMGPQDPEVYGEALQVTLAEADDILTMFNALLTIAVAESGAPRESFEQIDLSEIARSAVELYRPAAEEAGLDIRLRADRPVPLSGNPHLIMQALSNLLDNAIKYAKDSGAVWVWVDEKDGQAILGVADRGPGILDEFRDRAFDRFTRQEESRTTPGSGLGLSLVRAVARLHGGVVELEDNEPGLEVNLRLPIDRVSIVG